MGHFFFVLFLVIPLQPILPMHQHHQQCLYQRFILRKSILQHVQVINHIRTLFQQSPRYPRSQLLFSISLPRAKPALQRPTSVRRNHAPQKPVSHRSSLRLVYHLANMILVPKSFQPFYISSPLCLYTQISW